MSRKKMSRLKAISLVLPLLLAASPVLAQALQAVQRGPKAEWIEIRAWGGGARFVFDEPGQRSPESKAWAFLGGAALEFNFGCNSFDAAKSAWRFRASAGTLGSGVTGETERAFDVGTARVFGKPGQVVLIDASNREFARFDLTPRQNGLETGALTREQVEQFFSAAAIRAQTPELKLESGTARLRDEIAGIRKLACAFR